MAVIGAVGVEVVIAGGVGGDGSRGRLDVKGQVVA